MKNVKKSPTKVIVEARKNVKFIKRMLFSYHKKYGVKPNVEGHRIIFDKPFPFEWIDLEPTEKTMLNHLL